MNLSERKVQIVEFDRQFRNLIKGSPDAETKRDLNIALHHFRNRYCQTFDQKKAAVIVLLESGFTTLRELHAETHYRNEILIKILRSLVEDKKIQAVIYPMSGRGRATKKYFLL